VKKNIFFLKLRLKQLFEEFELDGVIMTALLFFFTFVLIFQIITVVNKAKYNYDIYVYEKNTLTDLQKRLEEGLDEFDYVRSEEYQTLLLRDAYSLAFDKQSLFRGNTTVDIVQAQEDELLKTEDLKPRYQKWWSDLIF
jgi:hypothetical protein